MNPRIKMKIKSMFIGGLIVFILVVFLIPILWMLFTSIRPEIDVFARPPVWKPRNLNFSTYAAVLGLKSELEKSVSILDYFLNSIIVSVLSVTFAMVVALPASFGFARFNFKGKYGVFLSMMLFRAVPGVALSLPLFILLGRLRLIDTKLALIITFTALNIPFSIWLMDTFFRDIPIELEEAAQIDGCSHFQIFFKISLPLVRPGIGAAGIFAFLTSWNEFAITSIITRTSAARTLTVGLYDFTTRFTVDWRSMCAVGFFMLLPAFIFTLIVQKHLIRGLTFGAGK